MGPARREFVEARNWPCVGREVKRGALLDGAIDIHAHVVLESALGAAGEHGPEIGADADGLPWFRVGDYRLDGVRYRGSAFMDADLRVEGMDRAGIAFQVLSPNPLTYFHHIEAARAVEFCRRHNDGMAEHIAQYPERLGGFAALPMQDRTAALAELERAVGTLGLLGGYVGTEFGAALDAPQMDDFYAGVSALDVPLFLHPAPPGIDGPPADARLRRFDLDLICGFAADETLAVATLIYGEVLARHPDLDVCISHGGGATPFLVGRMAQAARKRPWSPESLRTEGAFERALSGLWFDAHVHGQGARELLESVVGTQRLVMGTNFSGWDQGEVLELGAVAEPLAANARRLLRLPGGKAID
jgi:aminocarboxymuconate-semialdehyde decarboxylase